MISHTININVPHSLTRDEAFARLMENMIGGERKPDPNVDWDDVFASKKEHLINLNLLIRSVPVRAYVKVEPNVVTLKTSLIEGLVKAGIAFFVEPRIKAMLADALSKPLQGKRGDLSDAFYLPP